MLLAGFLMTGPAAVRAASMPREQLTPTVAYNSDLQHYFAMWVEDRGQGPDIYSKRLFANGLPQGGAARGGVGVISNSYASATGRHDPALTYNPDGQEYYLVWSEAAAGQGQDIMGVRVSSAGYGRGSPRVLAGGPGDQTHPAIAYNPTEQGYLLVWQDDSRDIDDIWGMRLRGNGIPSGKPFAMVQGLSNAQDPTVARRGTGFLVAWVDDRDGNSDIYARRLNANGLPIGGTQGAEYALAASLTDEFAPSLDPSSGTLVYNVYDPLTGLDIMGVEVYDNGATRRRSVGIAVPAADQASPASASNGGETVVVYSDNRSGEFDLYAIRVRNSRPAGRDYPVMKDGFTP
jgi:hypothetical protein